MLVSVIIVSKNAENTIKKCIDSILAQIYEDIEIIIVDSSNDGTVNIIKDYEHRKFLPIKVIYQKAQGVGIARNTGILNSNGEIIVLLDVDCWIYNDYIEEIVAKFNKDDKILTVFTNRKWIKPRGLFSKLVHLYDEVVNYDETINKEYMIDPMVARRKLFKLVGMYSENLQSGEDTELWYRTIEKRKGLEEQGYKFEVLDSVTQYEEKQGTDFRNYWKRCIWYGKALANKSYFFSSPLKNIAKLSLGIYFIALLITLVAFWEWWSIFIIPLMVLWCYVALKAFTIKRFSWLLMLMPILFFYKFIVLFLGFLSGFSEHL